MEDWTEDLGEAPVYRGVCGAATTPESFEVDEPHSKHSNWELIEYLSYSIAGVDDLDWLLKMQTLGRKLQRFDP
jgi:hypothetical protein